MILKANHHMLRKTKPMQGARALVEAGREYVASVGDFKLFKKLKLGICKIPKIYVNGVLGYISDS
jgi:hypothetical protein